jgi:Na+-transporting NADH:ubiquinone oxidoreductase subunit NqrB
MGPDGEELVATPDQNYIFTIRLAENSAVITQILHWKTIFEIGFGNIFHFVTKTSTQVCFLGA